MALDQRLAEQRNLSSGHVRIATCQVAACYLLPPVLAALQREEPGIQIELVVSNEITNLMRREADIAVRMARPRQTSLIAKRLADLPLVACAHRSYLQRMGTPKHPGDLARHQLIGYDQDNGLIKAFSRYEASITASISQYAPMIISPMIGCWRRVLALALSRNTIFVTGLTLCRYCLS